MRAFEIFTEVGVYIPSDYKRRGKPKSKQSVPVAPKPAVDSIDAGIAPQPQPQQPQSPTYPIARRVG